MARVLVVGAGVVGTATGKGLAAHGHDVTFCDIDPSRVAELRSEGRAADTTVDLSGPPALVFLVLPTPARDGHYDLRALRAGTVAVGGALGRSDAHHIVVLRSTVPPGTCDDVLVPLLEEVSGKRADVDFSVAANPEFLRSASAEADFLRPWMTVIGSRSERATQELMDLLRPFGGDFRIFPTAAEAEFVKCAHNLYNATKISFWNEMWRVAHELGMACDPIADTVARSAEGSFNPDYGIRGGRPFSGACLPKDTEGFHGFASDLGVPTPLLQAVLTVNQAMVARANGAASSNGAVEATELLDIRP